MINCKKCGSIFEEDTEMCPACYHTEVDPPIDVIEPHLVNQDKSKLVARPYQQEAFNDVIKSKNKEVVLELQIGSGKSKVASMLINHYIEEGKKVILMTVFTALISQLKNHLIVVPKIFQSTNSTDNDSDVILAMEQTLYKRLDKIHDFKNCIIIKDEQNGYGQKRTDEIMSFIKPEKLIVMSATPWKPDGTTNFPNAQIVNPISTKELISQGYLTPIKYMVPAWTKQLDFSQIKPTGGDYSSEEVEKVMDQEWYRTEFKQWINSVGLKDRATMMLVPTIDSCDMIIKLIDSNLFREEAKVDDKEVEDEENNLFTAEEQNKVNEPKVIDTYLPTIAIVHSKKSQKENEAATKAFNNGEVDTLISVMSLSIGFDSPRVDTIINLRASKIRSLNVQQARGSRIYKGKKYFEYFDLGNNILEHGFFYDEPYIAPFSKKEAKELSKEMAIPDIKNMLEEKDLEITPKILKAYRYKVEEMKKDLSNLEVDELIKVYDNERDIYEVIKIGGLIYGKLRNPITRSTMKWIIDEFEKIYPTILEKDLFTSMVKKRLKTIIKENKKFAAIRYYPTWIISNECYVNFTVMDKDYIKITEEDLW